MAEDQRRFDLANVISRTTGVLARRGWMFVALAAIVMMPTQFVTRAITGGGVAGMSPGIGSSPPGLMLGGFLSFVAGMILQIALVHAVVADGQGRRATFFECLGVGIRLFIPAFLLMLLTTISAAFGTLLLIVPGIMLYVMWILALPALVGERIGIIASLGRSRALTKGHRWLIFGLIVLLFVALAAVQGAVFQITMMVGGVGLALALVWLFSAALSALLSMIWATLLAALYVELREMTEGADPGALAEVFA
jgi:hypothetical protein